MSPSRKAPAKIIVDARERQSGIAETLSELGAEIEVAPLPAGDYAVPELEYRPVSLRPDDLVRSRDGRAAGS